MDANEMYAAVVESKADYDGTFFVAVKTTGIFCRPSCRARTPKRENVCFFPTAADALAAGFRPCKRCRPLHVAGATPEWLEPLLQQVDAQPERRWVADEIRSFGIDPTRVRRWFKRHHGITFHAYLRSRRLSAALAQLSVGDDVTRVALDAGYESISGFRDAFQKWFGAAPSHAPQQDNVMINRLLTPLGPMIAAADNRHLYLLEFADRRMLETQIQRLSRRQRRPFCPGENKLLLQIQIEMEQYFEGRRESFTVPFVSPGTEFQQRVWQQLQQIPYGTTLSYEQLASRVGRPKAYRAVGRANGDNRLAVLIPCHRVVRANGQMGGYGGGLRRKEWLLAHERTSALDRNTCQSQLPSR